MATQIPANYLFSQPADNERAPRLQTLKSVQKTTLRHENFGFGDLLDMFNPLHHIPVVSQLYSNATGDTISPVAKLVGGGLLGGVVGFAVAAISEVFEESTGKSLPGAIISGVTDPLTEHQQQRRNSRYSQIANAHKQDHHLRLDA